ncbi:MAG: glycoside hydrolase family 25 protein [Bellilinea sp.]
MTNVLSMIDTLGIDASRHQGKMNWQTAKSRKVIYAGVRATISWAYVDEQAQCNLLGAMEQGIVPLPYWVLHPNEDPKKQVDHYFNTLIGFGFDIKAMHSVIDVELYSGQHACTAAKYQSALSSALVYAKTITGKTPIIYSRASFIDSYVTGRNANWAAKPPAWYGNYHWWLAQYLSSGMEHPGPVKLPAGVERERCIIHQTSEKGDGPTYGAQSASIDLNRWQLAEAPQSWFGAVQVPVKPVGLTIEQRLDDVERRLSLLENC